MEIVIALVTVVINLIVLIVSAVWVVGRIQGSTDKLGLTINHLSQSIDRLNSWLNDVDGTVVKHGERLASLEARSKMKTPDCSD